MVDVLIVGSLGIQRVLWTVFCVFQGSVERASVLLGVRTVETELVL